MSTDAHDIQREVKKYILVFAGLMCLTIVTVAISYMKFTTMLAVTLALAVATIKATLVACYFMHLISERKFIFAVLIFTVVFFIVLMFLPVGSASDPITGTKVVS